MDNKKKLKKYIEDKPKQFDIYIKYARFIYPSIFVLGILSLFFLYLTNRL